MNSSRIETKRLILTVLDGEYSDMVSDFLTRNKTFFAPYETAKNEFFYSSIYQKNILETEYDAYLKKQYLRYYVFLRENPDLIIGTVSFGNITPFPYCQATLGYKIDKYYTRNGFATESINASLDEAFDYLNLHRIQAFVLEDNIPSINLLEKIGFHHEGLCQKNLNVQGEWKSHHLYSIVNSTLS